MEDMYYSDENIRRWIRSMINEGCTIMSKERPIWCRKEFTERCLKCRPGKMHICVKENIARFNRVLRGMGEG